MEERIRRHERILRHRYSKMLRRRALWERDVSSRLSWPWKLSNRWLAGRVPDAQTLSSAPTSRSQAEERRDDNSRKDSPLTTFHRDFESFKKAVDRAIERDPYGTLFGRRLQSPPSTNNSSWTSFSWIFDPKEIKEAKVESEKTASASSSEAPAGPTSAPEPIPRAGGYSANASRIPTSPGIATDEYEYDPISMRKVPRARPELSNPSTEASKPPPRHTGYLNTDLKPKAEATEPRSRTFFETLFGEHGIDIPVKIYKPPKVYGYRAEAKKGKPEDGTSPKRSLDFETSRKQEIKALKAKMLGNTIDTTAEYGGKYVPKEEITEPIPAPRAHAANSPNPRDKPAAEARDQSEPSDDTPLFSGTTYEGRSAQALRSKQPRSAWLRKEGFGVEQTAPKKNEDAVEIPVKKFSSKIEPSLDRVRHLSERPKEPLATTLASALDRQNKSAAPRISPVPTPVLLKEPVLEKSEDIDLLRASDVRAAVRSARISKQEKAEHKSETRKKLEDDFSTRQTQAETDQSLASDWGRSTISKSIDNVQNHIRQYPDGIVARTVKSMGMFNENWKKYVRPEPKVDLNKPLKFKDDSLSEVASMYKPQRKTSSSISFVPSKEVIEAERLSQQRSHDLQNSNVIAKERAEEEAAKASELARDLSGEYETQYGKINVRHRQKTSEEQGETQPSPSPENGTKTHPLSTATVKEGVPRYPVIESHIPKFEPKLSNLVQEAKNVRRELHEAQHHFRQLKERMNKKAWTEIETAGSKGARAEPGTAVTKDPWARGSGEPMATPPAQQIEARSENANPAVQDPIFTSDGSPIWNDEHPPPISELREAFTSPFVILKYNRETDSVSRLTAHFHEAAYQETLSPLKILSLLKHADKFYPYFSALEQAQYRIITCSPDTLIFRKIEDPSTLWWEETHSQATAKQAAAFIRDPSASKQEREDATGRVAAEEAAAQVVTQQIVDEPSLPPRTKTPPKDAATVLDEIPINIEPSPGPSAPTAPPSTPTSKPATAPATMPNVPSTQASKRDTPPIIAPAARPLIPAIEPTTTSATTPKHKVKRQEEVFSGTRTSRSGPQVTNPIDPEIAAPRPPSFCDHETSNGFPQASAFRRFVRTIKRVVLTTLILGVGAYVVGVITEGLDAKTQQKAIAGGNAGDIGPRKKVVMPVQQPEWSGKRAGIFSTESSR